MLHPNEFDDRDCAILAKREAAWNSKPGPRVGDFVIMPDGALRRFTYNWGDGLQTTWGEEAGSFYLDNGFASYSGGLEPSIPNERIEDTGETRPGLFWFFHHDEARAHNGVSFTIACRVFKVAA